MLGFHSISELPISSISVILILNGDIYSAVLSINTVTDFNSYINITTDISAGINRIVEKALDINTMKNSEAYINTTTEFIVSR